MKKSLSALLILFCLSCNVNELDFDNLKGPTLTSEVALPLGEISYTMRDLLNEIGDKALQLEEDSTSLLKLTYFDSAEFNKGEDVINIDDISNQARISLPALGPAPESQQAVIDTVLVFGYPAEKKESLDSVFYNGGNLVLTLNSNMGSDINFTFDITNTRSITGNEPVSFAGSLGGFGNYEESRELDGYKTLLTTEGDSNTFQVNAQITVFLGPGESTSASDYLNMTLSYLDQSFSILYGKFGQDTLAVGNEVLNIAFFEDLGESGFKFGDPEINFHFESTFGVPLGIVFRGLYGADSSASGMDTTFLSGSATVNPQVVEGAERPGQFVQSTVSLNSQNSSLRDLLAASPRSIGFNLTGIANPDDPTQQNFVMDDSYISTAIEISLPMELSLKDVTREIDFSLGDGLDFDEAESLTMRIISSNGLPFSARLEVEIRDNADSTLHTVPQALVLETPFIDKSGLVTQARSHVEDIHLTTEGVDALRSGSKVVLRVILNTPATSGTRDVYVKILADYKIDIKVAVVGKLKTEL
ncbi:MAG: hypothetical protein RIC30_16730 [Marinoscillum sp.]|uniref:hypothetical protein n=1 Tax=Marinoscillum sp. TaxID=2024838 RepID=UPI0032F4A93C